MTGTINFPIVSGNLAGFNVLPFGAGGFTNGIDFSADGTVGGHSTDVGNAYIKVLGTDTQWRPLLTTLTLPTADYDNRPDNYGAGLTDGDGTYCLRIAPSDKNVLIVGWNGFVQRSINAGASFTRCNLAAKRMFANTGEQRLWQPKFAIHPTDKNTFVVGTTADGQYYTQDGGQSFTSIGIAAGTTYGSFATPHLTVWDPGNTNYIYISRNGTGIYRASAGITSAFTAIPGGPTSARYMKVMPSGMLWVTATDGTLWRLPRGSNSWVQITPLASSLSAFSFAINPANETDLVVMNTDGGPIQSRDAGATWIGGSQWFGTFPAPIGLYQNAGSVPWLGTGTGGFFPSELAYRPAQTNELWAGQGIGISKSNPPATYTRWDWYDDSYGNETLGVACGLSIPGNTRPMFGCYDQGIQRPRNFDAPRDYPIFPNGAAVLNIDHLYSLDHAPEDVNYVMALCNLNHNISGYSTDGGATWQVFPAQHPDGAGGGQIVCTGVGKGVWIPANNGKAVRTSNGGTSWSYIDMGGSSGGIANWINSIFTRRYPGASDKSTAGKAVIVVNNSNQGITAGLYETLDHGATWVLKFSGVIDTSSGADTAQFWECKIKYIPEKAGELLYCGGIGTPDFNHKLKWSNNGGAAWSTLGSGVVDNCHYFDCDTPTGGSYPWVYIDAKVSGNSGLYRSKNFFATTPELLSRFPANRIATRGLLLADRNVRGRIFTALSGNGLLYGNV